MSAFSRIFLSALLAMVGNSLCAQGEATLYGGTAGYTNLNYVLSGEAISYTGVFANIGETEINEINFTCPASTNVFDISTIEVTNSSHETIVNYDSDTGILSIHIYNASLLPPGSGSDEGFFVFSLNSLADLPHNTPLPLNGTFTFDDFAPVSVAPDNYMVFDCSSFQGIMGQTEYCEGSQVELHTDDEYVETYTWYLDGEPWGNSDLLMIPSFPAMDYLISLELTNPVCTFTDEVLVTVSPSPLVTAGEDITICEGSSTEISATSDYSVSWNNGAGEGSQVSVSPGSSTLYTATSVNEFGCSGFDQQWVLVTPLPDNSISESNGWLIASEGDLYQWYFNGSVIDGATEQNLLIEETGYYSVVITNGTDCSVTSEEVFVVTVHELQKTDFLVYPNPAQDGIRLNLPPGTWNYFVYDNLGRTVQSGVYNSPAIINTSGLVSGCYSVVVAGNNALLNNTFMITR